VIASLPDVSTQAAAAGFPSGIEIAGGGAFLGGAGSAKRTEHTVKRGIADAVPVLLADEMMAQVVLLDPAAQPRSRLVGNMRDVVHPFIMQDRKPIGGPAWPIGGLTAIFRPSVLLN
jgi:hypothetical protein